MQTHPDYFRIAVETMRRQFQAPRPVDLAWPAEVEERAIRERNEAITVQAVRDTLQADLNDPRRI